MGDEQLEIKFIDQAEHVLGKQDAQKASETCWRIRKVEDVKSVVKLLSCMQLGIHSLLLIEDVDFYCCMCGRQKLMTHLNTDIQKQMGITMLEGMADSAQSICLYIMSAYSTKTEMITILAGELSLTPTKLSSLIEGLDMRLQHVRVNNSLIIEFATICQMFQSILYPSQPSSNTKMRESNCYETKFPQLNCSSTSAQLIQITSKRSRMQWKCLQLERETTVLTLQSGCRVFAQTQFPNKFMTGATATQHLSNPDLWQFDHL